ncbi:MAG: hypothetical protein JXP73_08160 [Deltaproteobacteria bacterium]|nr:hypothetical protein [Deltaproteobacteria bacterium]
MCASGLLAVFALAAATARPGRDAKEAATPIDAVPPSAVAPTATSYPNAAAALRDLLAGEPRVIAFGEFHQTKATARIPSALKRFTRDLLGPLRAAGATDLVVETWIASGACGEAEEKAVAQVDKATRRPARTENEVVTLLRRAKAGGMVPRILEVGCKDYQAMMGGAEVDFDRLLRLTREQLGKQILAALARPGSRTVLSYGGALHNDLRPSPEFAPYAFGPAVSAAVDGRYLEIDLYVPEFIAKNALVTEEPWYGVYRRAYRRGRVTLVRRGDSSYAIVFPRTR